MSNLLFENPIILDGVMASTYKQLAAAVLGTLFTFRVEKIEWYNPATIGDTFLITDSVGNERLAATCEFAGQSQIFDWTAKPRIWADWQLTQLSSGKVKLFTRL